MVQAKAAQGVAAFIYTPSRHCVAWVEDVHTITSCSLACLLSVWLDTVEVG